MQHAEVDPLLVRNLKCLECCSQANFLTSADELNVWAVWEHSVFEILALFPKLNCWIRVTVLAMCLLSKWKKRSCPMICVNHVSGQRTSRKRRSDIHSTHKDSEVHSSLFGRNNISDWSSIWCCNLAQGLRHLRLFPKIMTPSWHDCPYAHHKYPTKQGYRILIGWFLSYSEIFFSGQQLQTIAGANDFEMEICSIESKPTKTQEWSGFCRRRCCSERTSGPTLIA